MSMGRCKFCDAVIEWIEMGGRKIPLDTKTQTYEFNDRVGDWVKSSGYVAHTAVCKAKQTNGVPV